MPEYKESLKALREPMLYGGRLDKVSTTDFFNMRIMFAIAERLEAVVEQLVALEKTIRDGRGQG